jgi:hypothetical protein
MLPKFTNSAFGKKKKDRVKLHFLLDIKPHFKFFMKYYCAKDVGFLMNERQTLGAAGVSLCCGAQRGVQRKYAIQIYVKFGIFR